MTVVAEASRCLIGATGFVGSNLAAQAPFDLAVSRANIADAYGRHFDLVVCAGAPAAKWLANADPEGDRRNLASLVASVRSIEAKRIVLISTVDVFARAIDVTEDDDADDGEPTAYGRNRRWLEREIASLEAPVHVVRLPALFGAGLKKNLLRDLLDGTEEQFPQHTESRFQWYDVARLWSDLQLVVERQLELVHLAVPPIAAGELGSRLFGRPLRSIDTEPVIYRLRTKHDAVWGRSDGYIHDEREEWRRLEAFVASARTSAAP